MLPYNPFFIGLNNGLDFITCEQGFISDLFLAGYSRLAAKSVLSRTIVENPGVPSQMDFFTGIAVQ